MPYVNIRPVPGWEGMYSVTDDGRVWSHPRQMKHPRGGTATLRGRWLKPANNGGGYLMVGLSRNGKTKNYTVHRLTALAFIANPLALPQVNHIDGNRKNNTVRNLEWCDQLHNTRHSYHTGLSPKRLKQFLSAVQKSAETRKHRQATPAERVSHFKLKRRAALKWAAKQMQRRADELAQP